MRVNKSEIRALRRTSLTEIAVLEMTNDAKDVKKQDSTMVTAKEAYVWAAFMAQVAEMRPEVTPEQMLATITGPEIRKSLKLYYKDLPGGTQNDQPMAARPPDVIASAIQSLQLNVKTAIQASKLGKKVVVIERSRVFALQLDVVRWRDAECRKNKSVVHGAVAADNGFYLNLARGRGDGLLHPAEDGRTGLSRRCATSLIHLPKSRLLFLLSVQRYAKLNG